MALTNDELRVAAEAARNWPKGIPGTRWFANEPINQNLEVHLDRGYLTRG